MNFGVVVFPGSNCDVDAYHVIKNVLAQPVDYVWHQETNLSKYDCLVLPGGFSYGDYLRCGAIARFSPVMQAVQEHAARGKLVIGICNGFQILVEARLLPGALLKNVGQRFVCKFVRIRCENDDTPFTRRLTKGQVLSMPVAHGEGCYYCDAATLAALKANHQIVFRYDGDNPNGSLDDIAGICNRERNVLGMMPHPERAAEAILGSVDGRGVWESIVQG
ncbi:MAG: phosphoribosylformylglycinamidine synthase subunit PurQ [Abditibacteriales bacterium]|nr:phosphoribosylformylglycinamidine synthase subunit PurQ [Abditibacteriales bacterium]MDW8365122.1 phosphoribosylformylglycinamidine synthase subunit PurQ [Abditibacteriales bacterium]